MGSLINLPGVRYLRVISSAVAAALRNRQPDLTLDLLRSQLSHEVAAKIARLSGLLAEWRTGRYHPQDPADAALILDDMEAIILAHSRLAAAKTGTFWSLLRVQSSLCRLRHVLRPAGKGKALSIRRLEQFGKGLERLRARCRFLVDDLSSHLGMRLVDVVNAATDEIRREIGGGLIPGTVSIVLDEAAGGPSVWISRVDVPPWQDLFKNLIRNAVEATEERMRIDGPSPEAPPGPPTVTVSLTSRGARVGQLVEICDQGVGISEEDLERIWQGGYGRHGKGRGQGLTESKREFLGSRASFEVLSLPGSGTTLRIEVPHRTIPVTPPPPWRLRSLTIPAAVLILAGVAWAWSAGPRLDSVKVAATSHLVGLGLHGDVLWDRDFGQEIMRNYLFGTLRGAKRVYLRSAAGSFEEADQVLLRRDARGRILRLATATQPSEGPGVFWFLDARGRVLHRIPLRWQAPTGRAWAS